MATALSRATQVARSAAVVPALDRLLRRTPAQAYFRRTSARRVAVLAYHGVDDPDRFAAQMAYLRQRLSPVSLSDVIDAGRGVKALPSHAALVTFDDGHRSLLERGLPILREWAIPAVAFVMPGVVGTTEPFWWTEAEELVACGGYVGAVSDQSPSGVVRWLKTVTDQERRHVLADLRDQAGPAREAPQLTVKDLATLENSDIEVENHSWDHPCLDRCDDEQVSHQVRAAHDWLARTLGRTPRAFAYPNGNWDERVELILRELHYEAGFLFDHNLARAHSSTLRLSRLRVNSSTSLDRFATILSGLHPALHRLRGGV